MTIKSVSGLYYPDTAGQYGNVLVGGTAFASLLIDAAAEKVAGVFYAPKAGNIARLQFRTTAVTVADTLKVSFQDVDLATGDPDGTADQFRTVASGSVTANTWIRTGLVTSDGTDTGSLRAVAAGDLVAWVIEFDSFVAGNLNIAAKAAIGSTAPWVGRHYVDHFTAAWAKQNSSLQVVAVEYDDGTFAYIPNTFPFVTHLATTVSSATTPDEIALKFRLPFAARVGGWWAEGNWFDGDVVLYDVDGTTALKTNTVDKDVRQSAGNLAMAGMFSSSQTLTPNVFYRLAYRPSTATSNTHFGMTANSAAILDQTSGGQDCHWSQRTDAGAWTDTTTQRPVMGLILDGLDDGTGTTGGGAPVIHRGRGRYLR